MNLTEFKRQINDLNVEIKGAYADHENEVNPIFDGAFNCKEYYNSKSPKIMWLIKEAYEEGEREGGWSYPDFYTNDYERFYRDLIRGKSNSTWQPIVYASYAIHNNFYSWEDLPDIDDDPAIVKILDKIAVVNIQKLPSETGSRTEMPNIFAAYEKHKAIINKQIELLNPDVIICGNIFSVIKNDLKILEEGKFNSVEYHLTAKRLFINAYHPAQKTISREDYVNDIIRCVNEFYNCNNTVNHGWTT